MDLPIGSPAAGSSLVAFLDIECILKILDGLPFSSPQRTVIGVLSPQPYHDSVLCDLISSFMSASSRVGGDAGWDLGIILVKAALRG